MPKIVIHIRSMPWEPAQKATGLFLSCTDMPVYREEQFYIDMTREPIHVFSLFCLIYVFGANMDRRFFLYKYQFRMKQHLITESVLSKTLSQLETYYSSAWYLGCNIFLDTMSDCIFEYSHS